MVKKEAEKKAYHAGKLFPKVEIQGDHCRNRRPHICRGGNRKNSIPDESPIPSCSLAESNGVAAAGRTAVFLTITDPFFPLLRSSPDRGAVTGKSQVVGWINPFWIERSRNCC